MPLEWLEARCPALVGWVVWKSSLAVCNIIFLQDTFALLCNWHSAHEKDVGSSLDLLQIARVYCFFDWFIIVFNSLSHGVLLALFSCEAFFSETSHFESKKWCYSHYSAGSDFFVQAWLFDSLKFDATALKIGLNAPKLEVVSQPPGNCVHWVVVFLQGHPWMMLMDRIRVCSWG